MRIGSCTLLEHCCRECSCTDCCAQCTYRHSPQKRLNAPHPHVPVERRSRLATRLLRIVGRVLSLRCLPWGPVDRLQCLGVLTMARHARALCVGYLCLSFGVSDKVPTGEPRRSLNLRAPMARANIASSCLLGNGVAPGSRRCSLGNIIGDGNVAACANPRLPDSNGTEQGYQRS